MSGVLYLVATPIGNLNDMTFRAIETLKYVDYIACEDTRNSIKLLKHFNIDKKLIAYHNFNENQESERLLKDLENGLDIAIISDAGYPLISDPGYSIVSKVIEANIKLEVIPGCNAGITALVASGLDTSHYLFYGFLNSKKSQCISQLNSLKYFPYTLIFYEAPHRINYTLENMLEVFGDRHICIAREITKLYQEFKRGKISELKDLNYKGEIVLLVSGYQETANYNEEEIIKEIAILCEKLKLNQACKIIADKYNCRKSEIYDIYLKSK